VNPTRIGSDEEVGPEAEVDVEDVVVEEADLGTRVVQEWVIIHLDPLETVVEGVGITDHMVVPLPLLRHMDHTHHLLKPLTEDTVIQVYRQTPMQAVEDHHLPQRTVLETHTQLHQRHMVGTHHHLHREVGLMVRLRPTPTAHLLHAMVMAMEMGTVEPEMVVDMVDMVEVGEGEEGMAVEGGRCL